MPHPDAQQTAGIAALSSARDGATCYRCGYDLTGLPRPRCPECGVEFDWTDPRLDANYHRGVAFEKARTIPGFAWGFVLTWLTVVCVPWIFARQTLRRISLARGLLFAAVCMLSTAGAYFHEPGWDIIIAWVVTAIVYMPAQSLVLSLFDKRFYRRPRAALAFWSAVTCYTSAIMVLEAGIGGPPVVLLSDLSIALTGRYFDATSLTMPDMYSLNWSAALMWGVFAVWLAGLLCCVFARARSNGHAGSTILVMLLLVAPALVLLYALALHFVGGPLTVELVGWPL